MKLIVYDRTLVYIDADASMRSYTDGEGRKQNSLSILQRKPPIYLPDAFAKG